MTSSFLAAALDLSRRGFAVFPLKPKSKIPLIPRRDGGRGCLDATRDGAAIREWWSREPMANVGIATGAISGVLALDVDPHSGGDGSLAALERQHGDLPLTVESLTGGGGQHLLFRHVPGIGNSAGAIGAGLDVRSDHGYIVAPPSVHESGRVYCWNVDRHPDETPIGTAPLWLIKLLIGKKAREGAVDLPVGWRKLVAEGVGKGRRNYAIARLVGHLLRPGVDPYVALDLMRTWNLTRCHPPLADGEVVGIVNSICGRELCRYRADR